MRNLYMLTIALLTLIAFSFNFGKCEHVFVETKEEYLKVEKPDMMTGGLAFDWPSGIHEGVDLVCVKCLHQRRQVIDYGERHVQPEFPTLLWLSGPVDTLRRLPLNSGWLIKTDSKSVNAY